jgi:hypothetical protein
MKPSTSVWLAAIAAAAARTLGVVRTSPALKELSFRLPDGFCRDVSGWAVSARRSRVPAP